MLVIFYWPFISISCKPSTPAKQNVNNKVVREILTPVTFSWAVCVQCYTASHGTARSSFWQLRICSIILTTIKMADFFLSRTGGRKQAWHQFLHIGWLCIFPDDASEPFTHKEYLHSLFFVFDFRWNSYNFYIQGVILLVLLCMSRYRFWKL